MIKALVDTNVVLDALAGREPYRLDAEKIFTMAASREISGFITANSFTDIYYILRRFSSEEAARQAIRSLLLCFSIVDVSGNDCEKALDSVITDFEDALAHVCAERVAADYIITRDMDFLMSPSAIPIATPAGFVTIFAPR